MKKLLVISTATLMLTGCYIDARVDYSEIQAHASQCDKNNGVKQYGLVDIEDDLRYAVGEVVCNDGAVFSFDYEKRHTLD